MKNHSREINKWIFTWVIASIAIIVKISLEYFWGILHPTYQLAAEVFAICTVISSDVSFEVYHFKDREKLSPFLVVMTYSALFISAYFLVLCNMFVTIPHNSENILEIDSSTVNEISVQVLKIGIYMFLYNIVVGAIVFWNFWLCRKTSNITPANAA
jgi:hypothetical protein